VFGHWLRLSLVQDLGTGIQDFFVDAVKVSVRAKFIFAEGFQTSQFATDWFLIAASQMTNLIRGRNAALSLQFGLLSKGYCTTYLASRPTECG
jgi:hypothetical protein